MQIRARRLLSRPWRGLARRVLLALCLLPPGVATAQTILSAGYDMPTTRYPHGVLGDSIEHITLVLDLSTGEEKRFVLPDELVFEDTAPRLADLDGDGAAEVIVVESSQTSGARLAIYGPNGRIAATPHIGTRFRWLAPVGAADLDGDGRVEVAFVDRPHLAKTLNVYRFEDGRLTQWAMLSGLTNHRIGERDIAGGIRTCRGHPEMIVASANWASLVAVSFKAGEWVQTPIGTDTSRAAFAQAMACLPE
ncbi:VCBS repeat-containing protein [Roseobacter sp. YSTF-M11]|uniref:VCBS repeat-containing protein n=1 Tax=Roseobacter insulae TaxID=2859783 RepID=A0A9X1K2H2_9RHOB|nr:VCBS repeat-containing protein [Roseobacter insulae]MBW4710234.1 VCBS repeat-containing protein [Roseobacter insulae]